MSETAHFTGEITVAYGCFLFEADDLPQVGQPQEAGHLVDRGDGQVELLAGREDGPIQVTVEVHSTTPHDTDDEWTATAELRLHWETHRVFVVEVPMGRDPRWEIPLPWYDFVLRASFREGDDEVWLIQLWPPEST